MAAYSITSRLSPTAVTVRESPSTTCRTAKAPACMSKITAVSSIRSFGAEPSVRQGLCSITTDPMPTRRAPSLLWSFIRPFPTKPSPSGPIPTGRRCCRSIGKIPLPFPMPTITLFSPARHSMPMGGWRGRVCFPMPTIIRETMIMRPATIGNPLPFLP